MSKVITAASFGSVNPRFSLNYETIVKQWLAKSG